MSVKATQWAWDESRCTGAELLVLLAIADEANGDGLSAFPSLERIATRTRRSVSGTRDAIERLEEAGQVLVWRPHKYGRGRHNFYALTMGRPADDVAKDLMRNVRAFGRDATADGWVRVNGTDVAAPAFVPEPPEPEPPERCATATLSPPGHDDTKPHKNTGETCGKVRSRGAHTQQTRRDLITGANPSLTASVYQPPTTPNGAADVCSEDKELAPRVRWPELDRLPRRADKTRTRIFPPEFEALWAVWHPERRPAKATCYAQWQILVVTDGTDPERLVAAARAYTECVEAVAQPLAYVKTLNNFLAADYWTGCEGEDAPVLLHLRTAAAEQRRRDDAEAERAGKERRDLAARDVTYGAAPLPMDEFHDLYLRPWAEKLKAGEAVLDDVPPEQRTKPRWLAWEAWVEGRGERPDGR